MLRIAIVANKGTPYRIPVFGALSRMPGVVLRVIFCSEREPDRLWDMPQMDFDHVILRERFLAMGGRYIHHNPDVFAALRHFSPDVIVTGGFNPTHLYAFLYAVANGLPHVAMTDGTYDSEQKLSAFHRRVRRFVYARSAAFVAASAGGQRLYESYRIPSRLCFHSCLAIDNGAFSAATGQEEKRFDFMFCGRMEPAKSPRFALEVALASAARLGRKVRLLMVGAGSEEEALKIAAAQRPELLEAEFHGFAAQSELPALYRSARIFLFPTQGDVWGVVANEACAAGLPVIVSPHAGVAGELVREGENGFICPLDAEQWADRAVSLLAQPQAWRQASMRSLSLVAEYTHEKAASGLLAACRFSTFEGKMDSAASSI